MHFLLVSLRKDWARVRRDPFQLITSLGIPLVLAILMSVIFGRDPAAPHGVLLVTDEDGTIASARLLDAFHNEQVGKMLDIVKIGREAGRAQIDRGDASAFLIIPHGFQQAFLFNLPFHLQLFTNPSESILPQVVEESLTIAADASFYMRRGVAYPPRGGQVGLETQVVRERKRSVSFAAQFLPSMLFMGLLFLANSMAADIWRERISGTLRRLASGPVSMAAYVVSRMVFVALIYGLVAGIGLATAQRLAGMPVESLTAATAWMTFTGTVFYLLFLWITTRASTQRASAVLANLVIFPLAMLGGCFFPFAWMPAWMVRIGRVTPNGLALTEFQSILGGNAEWGAIGAAAALLAGAGVLTFWLTVRRLHDWAS